MHHTHLKGKWASEFYLTESLLKIMTDITLDFATVQGRTPEEIIFAIEAKLQQLKQSIQQNSQKHSFFDDRLEEIQDNIQTLELAIQQIKKDLQKAERQAKKLSDEFKETVARPVSYYKKRQETEQKNQSFEHPETTYIFPVKNTFSIFEASVDPHYKTWAGIRAQLSKLSNMADAKHNKHNSLAVLLILEDDDYIKTLGDGNITISEEIGFLHLQRLKEIQLSSPKMALRAKAYPLIQQAVTSAESLFRYNPKSLEKEINKLALHASLYPQDKIVWLGSGHTVIANINKEKNEAKEHGSHVKGIYLNCDDSRWTWALNRAWLQAAIKLGYTIRLIEQHLPAVEKAILSGDPVQVIEQLAREIRSINDRSQYHGGDSPTATPQEILALMDLGCVGQKNKDGSLSLVPRKKIQEDLGPIIQYNQVTRVKRSHSSPNLLHVAPQPPLSKREHLFKTPPPSTESRKQTARPLAFLGLK